MEGINIPMSFVWGTLSAVLSGIAVALYFKIFSRSNTCLECPNLSAGLAKLGESLIGMRELMETKLEHLVNNSNESFRRNRDEHKVLNEKYNDLSTSVSQFTKKIEKSEFGRTLNKNSILIIDDDMTTSDVLSRNIKSLFPNIEVIEINNVSLINTYLKEYRFNLALVDLYYPQYNNPIMNPLGIDIIKDIIVGCPFTSAILYSSCRGDLEIPDYLKENFKTLDYLLNKGNLKSIITKSLIPGME